MLEIKDLVISYGAIEAVKGINVTVNQGEIVTLIGSNGAGKTSTLHTISGLVKPKSGTITFMGEEIQRLPAHKVVEKGIAHVPEGRHIFSELTVYENLLLGANIRKDSAGIKEDLEWVWELFPRLLERKNQPGGTLSGGEQQMLAVGRAIMTHGKLLLLDEPSMGLAPLIVESIFNIIQVLKDSGMTILLVEQNANMALQIADRAYVLQTGEVVMEGDAKELKANPAVKAAYLGA